MRFAKVRSPFSFPLASFHIASRPCEPSILARSGRKGMHAEINRSLSRSTLKLKNGPSKPEGGFRFLTVFELVLLWRAYKTGLIRLADLRVYFACLEMDTRRCVSASAKKTNRFTVEELCKLVGLDPKRAKQSLCRLKAAKLLAWSEERLEFASSCATARSGELPGFAEMLGRTPNHRRRIPAPRRILRLLAGGARPSLIAAVLGHMLWCLYYREGRCEPRGRVKASWIAEVFEVDLRRVKEARGELIEMKWLIPLEAGQIARNKWGGHFEINLNWSRLKILPEPFILNEANFNSHVPPFEASAPAISAHSVSGDLSAGQKSPPPTARFAPKSPPPLDDRKPLTEEKRDQKPACGGEKISGNFSIPIQPRESLAASKTVKAKALLPPALSNVLLEDLKDTGRLLELYQQAVKRGLVKDCEGDRLKFVAAAEHARVVGTKNPPGLFVRIARSGLWRFITQDDEDAAQERLKRHFHGQTPNSSHEKPAAEGAAIDVVLRSCFPKLFGI